MASPADIQAIFDRYGVPASAHADGSTEDPTARLARLASSGRSLADIEASVQQIAAARGSAAPTTGGGGTGGGQAMQAMAQTGEGGFTASHFPSTGDVLGMGGHHQLAGAYFGTSISVAAFIGSMSPELLRGLTDQDIANLRATYSGGIPADAALSIAQRMTYLVTNDPNYNTGAGASGPGAGAGQGQGYGLGQPAGSIPSGGTLYSVTNPDGTRSYFVTWTWEGVEFGYRIGTQEEFNSIFGPAPSGRFAVMREITQAQYDAIGVLELGTVDEILGQTESIGSMIYQQLRTYGMEALPDWIRGDRQALFISAQGALEGWSPGRVLRELSSTTGFKARFTAWGRMMDDAGGDELAAMNRYVQVEGQLTEGLRRYRGPNADTSPGYVGRLMTSGWSPEAILPILSAESRLRSSPGTMEDLNRILTSVGMQPLGNVGMIAMLAAGQLPDEQARQALSGIDLTSLLNGNDPAAVFDIINDAITVNALEEAGLRNLSLGFVRQLRNETGGVLDADQVGEFAQTAALNVLRFSNDIDLSRFGLTEEEVVSAAANRPSPGGRAAADNLEIMNRILRERKADAGGYDQFTGFQDSRGRLVVPGLRGL